MKAFFPIVGEKEYKDSILRTKRRQFVFTKLRVESYLSHSCRSRLIAPTWASQREQASVRSVQSVWKKIFVSFALLPPFGLWAFGESRVPHVSAPPRTKIREIGEIRMPIKIFVLSALFVFKKYSVRSVCPTKIFVSFQRPHWISSGDSLTWL